MLPNRTASSPRRRGVSVRRLGVAATVGLCAAALVVPGTAQAASRVPGTPVPQVGQVDQSPNGGTNKVVGTVPSTASLGRPDPGTVPVVGDVDARADDGATVYSETRVDARTVDLVVQSPAVGGYVPVRVQLPPTWTTTPRATYPSLYLLQGGNEKADYQSWSLYSTQTRTTRSLGALVVMPSLGASGYATNWFNWGLNGALGKQYDTFVATELPQLLQRGYRANGRASVAGISSGATSALALAALHPGAYGAAASFSGLADTQLPVVAQTVEFGPVAQFRIPTQMWGSSLLNAWVWSSRNPAAQVSKLRGTAVWVSAGNGQAGPLTGASTDAFYEPIVLASTNSFLSRARAAGVPVTADLYGGGTHSWPYWSRELVRALPTLRAGMGI